MRGTMSMEVLKRRRAEMLPEAELNRLKKAERKRPAAYRWASTVVRDLAGGAGVLRESFQTPKNAD